MEGARRCAQGQEGVGAAVLFAKIAVGRECSLRRLRSGGDLQQPGGEGAPNYRIYQLREELGLGVRDTVHGAYLIL